MKSISNLKSKKQKKSSIKRKIILYLIMLVLITIYSYILVIEKIPEEYIVFENDVIDVNMQMGLKLVEKNKEKNEKKETVKTYSLNIFNKIPIKDINVKEIQNTQIIPVGEIVGLKLYTDGVLVVGMSEIEGEKPYLDTGIKEGDNIIEVNDTKVKTTLELQNAVNKSEGAKVEIKYVNENEIQTCSITPIKVGQDYKLGLWVRDSAAGIGTVTMYIPQKNMFIALGHGISDIDTGEMLKIDNGEFVTTEIIDVIKGKTNNPGRIQGSIENSSNIGTVVKNTKYGVYGILNGNLNIKKQNTLQPALRNEIRQGNANILCNVDGKGIKEYNIEINKIYTENISNNKSMEIKITDKELIGKTGGIIQGMSGSPIIQNGKIVGAVTHVFVNDATRGYATFIENMLDVIE